MVANQFLRVAGPPMALPNVHPEEVSVLYDVVLEYLHQLPYLSENQADYLVADITKNLLKRSGEALVEALEDTIRYTVPYNHRQPFIDQLLSDDQIVAGMKKQQAEEAKARAKYQKLVDEAAKQLPPEKAGFFKMLDGTVRWIEPIDRTSALEKEQAAYNKIISRWRQQYELWLRSKAKHPGVEPSAPTFFGEIIVVNIEERWIQYTGNQGGDKYWRFEDAVAMTDTDYLRVLESAINVGSHHGIEITYEQEADLLATQMEKLGLEEPLRYAMYAHDDKIRQKIENRLIAFQERGKYTDLLSDSYARMSIARWKAKDYKVLQTAEKEREEATLGAMPASCPKIPGLRGDLTLYPHQARGLAILAANDATGIIDVEMGGGKCIVGNSIVTTKEGLLTFDELAGDLLPGNHLARFVTFGERGFEEPLALYIPGPQRVIHMTTELGYWNCGTYEHPIRVLGTDGELVWKRMDQLKLGDACVIPYGSDVWGSQTRLPAFDYTPYRSSIDWPVPTEMTPELARILGYLIAEGTLADYGTFFTNYDAEVLQDFTRCLAQSCPGCPLDQNEVGVTPVSAQFDAFRRNLGLVDCLAWEKSIPRVIRQAPRHIVVEFLRALYEGDGFVDADGNGEKFNVHYATTSKQLHDELKVVLANLGVVTSSSFAMKKATNGDPDATPQPCWGLTANHRFAKVFLDEVGFISSRKQEAATAMLARYEAVGNKVARKHDRLWALNFTLTNAVQLLIDECEAREQTFCGVYSHDWAGSMRRLLAGQNVTIQLAQKFLHGYTEGPIHIPQVEKLATNLRAILEAKFVFSPVAELIVNEMRLPVFDAALPPGSSHSFFANGLIQHNTLLMTSDILIKMASGKVRRPLIVMPDNLLGQQKDEIEYYTEGKVNVIVVNTYTAGSKDANIEQLEKLIDSAPSNTIIMTSYKWLTLTGYWEETGEVTSRGAVLSTNVFPHVQWFKARNVDMVVLDESHNVKNAGSLQSQAALQLTSVPIRRISTGTLASNTPTDLIAQCQFVDPMMFGNEKEFLRKFCLVDPQTGKVLGWRPGAFQEIQRVITANGAVQARRTNWAHLLPDRVEEVHHVRLSKEQLKVYKIIFAELMAELTEPYDADGNENPLYAIWQKMQEDGGDVDIPARIITKLVRFDRYLCAPSADPNGDLLLKGKDRVSPKIAKADEIIAKHFAMKDPGKILYMVQNAASAKHFIENSKYGKDFLYYDAGYKQNIQRLKRLDSVRGLAAVDKSLREGFNLQECNRVIRGDIPVAAGTLVSTKFGLVPIETTEANWLVDTAGQAQITDGPTCRGIESTLDIRTQQGYECRFAYDHTIMVFNPKTQEVTYKEAQDIRVGDFIATKTQASTLWPEELEFSDYIPLSSEIDDNGQLTCTLCGHKAQRLAPHLQSAHGLTFQEYSKKFKKMVDNTGRLLLPELPTTMTLDLARLLGYIIGDGWHSKKYEFGFCSWEPEILRDFERCVTSCFGMSCGSSRENHIAFGGASIQHFLEWVGIELGTDATRKTVPWSILQAPKECVLEFLAGLWCCDGSSKAFYSSSPVLIQQVQLLFQRLGWPATVSATIRDTNFKEDSHEYSLGLAKPHQIAFVQSCIWPKCAKTQAMEEMFSSRPRAPWYSMVPGAYEKYHVDLDGMSSARIRDAHKIKKLFYKDVEQLATPTNQTWVLQRQLGWSPVTSISQGPQVPVWCLKNVREEHNFVANGMIVSNCWNPGDMEQGFGRVYRPGQTRPVFIDIILADGTADIAKRARVIAKKHQNQQVSSSYVDASELPIIRMNINTLENFTEPELLEPFSERLADMHRQEKKEIVTIGKKFGKKMWSFADPTAPIVEGAKKIRTPWVQGGKVTMRPLVLGLVKDEENGDYISIDDDLSLNWLATRDAKELGFELQDTEDETYWYRMIDSTESLDEVVDEIISKGDELGYDVAFYEDWAETEKAVLERAGLETAPKPLKSGLTAPLSVMEYDGFYYFVTDDSAPTDFLKAVGFEFQYPYYWAQGTNKAQILALITKIKKAGLKIKDEDELILKVKETTVFQSVEAATIFGARRPATKSAGDDEKASKAPMRRAPRERKETQADLEVDVNFVTFDGFPTLMVSAKEATKELTMLDRLGFEFEGSKWFKWATRASVRPALNRLWKQGLKISNWDEFARAVKLVFKINLSNYADEMRA